jgi:hypothetical protein
MKRSELRLPHFALVKGAFVPDWSRITNLVMRAPKGVHVVSGTETASFKVLDPSRIELKPGVIATEETQPDGRVVYLLTSPSGDTMGTVDCRCPAGYDGSCPKGWTEGGPILQCSGTCTHIELQTMKAKCGWFSTEPKKLFGLIKI